jgi:histidinol dehydrogenase
LNVLDFVHIVSLVALDPATTPHRPAAATIALTEGLDAHAYSAQVRVQAVRITLGFAKRGDHENCRSL